jgi:hypothetical protein
MRKGEVKGLNKCKVGKNKDRKAPMGFEKRRVARGGKNIIVKGGGIKIVFKPNIEPWD